MQSFLDGSVVLHHGDNREVLRSLADNSVDSVVTDPPYALVSIVKRFGGENAAPCKEGKTGAYARASKGFMGKTWDTGDTVHAVEFWQEVYRVLKPGGHVAAFNGTRTQHRMVCAIEDAGFEIRDMLAWLYGTGFPKSHDVSKGIDKAAGAEREVIRERYTTKRLKPGATVEAEGAWGKQDIAYTATDTAPSTLAAQQWQGWGTALKPALEPICLARKPLVGTVAANVLLHGTGAINIDGCRVGGNTAKRFNPGKDSQGNTIWCEQCGERPATYNTEGEALFCDDCHAETVGRPLRVSDPKDTNSVVYSGRLTGGDASKGGSKAAGTTQLGRWPANVITDGSEEVVAMFPHSKSGTNCVKRATGSDAGGNTGSALGKESRPAGTPMITYGDEGSAARFFYSAKANKKDRVDSKHPTVKPISLMRWLCRLVTPPGGTIIDPFAGSGTTGEAAYLEGFNTILIEREEEYVADITRRLESVQPEPANDNTAPDLFATTCAPAQAAA